MPSSYAALYEVFLKVRDSAAKILESTSIADLLDTTARPRKRSRHRGHEKDGSLVAIGDKGAKR